MKFGHFAGSTLPRTLPRTLLVFVTSHAESGGEADVVSPEAQGLWQKLCLEAARSGFHQFAVKIAVKVNRLPATPRSRGRFNQFKY
jgi:hypothetical protein